MLQVSAFSLAGKTIFITGGTRGLGYAMARACINNGATVIITGRTESAVNEACKTLGASAHGIAFDLSNLTGIPQLIATTEEQYGAIDTLINNAGIHLKKNATEVTDEEFAEVIKINQQAVFALTREWSKKMIERNNGSIIFISSMASRYGIPKVIAYTAAKSAVEGMTRALAVELSPLGIRVNCIAPGFILTNMSSKALDSDPERKQKVLSRTPMAKLGTPEDIGNAAVFLASDAASFITGVVLPVDGGNSIGF